MPAGWAGGFRAVRGREAVTKMMPLARYFLFVGGALMALLFAFDFFSPKAAADVGAQGANAAMVDKSTLRIRSEQKWPERIVLDTTQPTIVPKAAETQQAAIPAPAPEITATARVRETFAQFVPVEPRKPETAAPKKRKVAKGSSQPMRFARSGAFGTSTW